VRVDQAIVDQAIKEQERTARTEGEEQRQRLRRRPYNVVDEADAVLARAQAAGVVVWTCSRTGSVFGKIFLRTACAFRHGYASVKVDCLCYICLTQAMQPYKSDITMCFGGDVFLPKNGTCP